MDVLTTRWLLIAVWFSLSGCYPFDETLARCADAGRCRTGEADAGVAEAGPDFELALWPVPPEAPSQYLVQGAIVLDQRTGLAWQQSSLTASSWEDAVGQCDHLNTAGYGGAFTGWRLPTEIELLSIVDSTALAPAINTSAFPAAPSVGFWSASRPGTDAGVAWQVGFAQGDARLLEVGLDAGVRCLRSSPASLPSPRLTGGADGGVVRDEVTRLTWQAGRAPNPLSEADAVAYCTTLGLEALDGGWRLPGKKELETLVDRRGGGSTIDPSPFRNALLGTFWSSTPVKNTDIIYPPPAESWGVDFSSGRSTGTPNSFLRNVRCVR